MPIAKINFRIKNQLGILDLDKNLKIQKLKNNQFNGGEVFNLIFCITKYKGYLFA